MTSNPSRARAARSPEHTARRRLPRGVLQPLLALLFASVLGAQPASDRDAGVQAFDARRYEQARPRLEAALRSDPKDARAALLLGKIALVEGDGAEAARWLERAVAAAPRDAESRWWLGRAYARELSHAGRLAQLRLARRVRETLERAVALDAEHVEARQDLMRFYLAAPGIAGGSTDRARAQAREIARRSTWRGRVAEGAIAEKVDDHAGAERAYRAAIAAAPDSVDGYLALGAMFERERRWDEAFDTFDALHARTSATVAHYHVGRVASLSGRQVARGVKELERYLARPPAPGDPSLASAWYRLGMLHERERDRAAARRAYERTLALDPRQSDARDALARMR